MQYTAEQLAQKIADRRAVENVMGRFSFLRMYKRTQECLDTLWCSPAAAPSLTMNDCAFHGYEAVKKQFVTDADTATRANNEIMRGLYPDAFAGKSDDEMWGAGSNLVATLTTPVVELSADGKTAKGLWYAVGENTEVGPKGPAASWVWAKYGVDFIKEDGVWKIWHMTVFTDFDTPVGQNWAEINNAPSGEHYAAYTPKVSPQNAPPVPVSYTSFAETFSY